MASLLTSLPPEVIDQIIRNLDPVSLITLSQTSKELRAFINPTHHDFVRRLLALELMPEHGGIVPVLRSHGRGNQLFPPWNSKEWKRNKYACCSCMKLLPHMMFDNHAILRLPYRKPPPGSIEADRAAFTDWEPLDVSTRWKKIQVQSDRDRDEQQKRRKAVAAEYRKLVRPVGQPFAALDRTLVNAAEEEAERYTCGTSRHRRRCIECQRKRGHWTRLSAHYGTAEELLVVSRQLPFIDSFDKCFPSLLDPLPLDKVARMWTVYREDARTCLYSMFAAYCPTCGTWQEMAALRLWEAPERFPMSREPPTEPALCNHCYLKTHQDPSELAEGLSTVAAEMLQDSRKGIIYKLGFGWRILHQDFFGQHGAALKEYQPIGSEILDGVQWVDPDRMDAIVFEESDLPDLRRRVHRFRDFIKGVKESTRAKVMQKWFKLWVEDYDLLEEQYHRLGRQITWIENNPTHVLDHVIQQDPYRIYP